MSGADDARELFESGRVARLATADLAGHPHVVVICFAIDGDTIVTAVDRKPKRTERLKRLDNVRLNPRVSLLVDHYDDDDWSRLWWARADGRARVIDAAAAGHAAAAERLADRYEQYRGDPPTGPAIEVTVERWSSWRAADR